MHAFILAGGFATRLWPLTEHRAKPLLPIAGKPIIEYLLDGIPENLPITISTNSAFGEDFQAWIQTITRPNVELVIEHTRSDDQKLGTLGALKQWTEARQIEDDILLITGDNYLGFSMETFLSVYRPSIPLIAAFDVQDKEKASAFGTVLVGEDGKTIIGFEEKPREPKTSLVSSGCTIIPKQLLQILQTYAQSHPDNVGGIFEEFLRQGIGIDCFTFSEPWLDIGSFSAYLDANRLLIGTTPIIQSTHDHVQNSTLSGSIFIGKNCTVEKSELTDCILYDNSHIHNCVLTNCVIDTDCFLENVDLTNKMIRQGTILRRPV